VDRQCIATVYANHFVQFIPVGESISNPSSVRTVRVEMDKMLRGKIEKLKERSYKESDMDEFALRNHWYPAKVIAEYQPTYQNIREINDKLQQIDGVAKIEEYETVQNNISKVKISIEDKKRKTIKQTHKKFGKVPIYRVTFEKGTFELMLRKEYNLSN